MSCDVFASAPLVADEEPDFPTVAHDVCGTNIGSLSRRAELHSPCNLGIAPGLWTTTPYVVEIIGAQTFGEGQGLAFGRDGKLYATDFTDNSGLYLIDPKTGLETSIAALPFGLSSALELGNPRTMP